MSTQVSYRKQIIVFLILFALLIFAVEIGIRVIEYFDGTTDNKCEFIGKDAFKNVEKIKQNQICKDYNSAMYEIDGILKHTPNQNMETVNINSHGFRGNDFSETKDSDTYRIFLVGGSTVYGSGSTSDATTIPGFLQKKLENIDTHQKIEVINAGIGNAYSYSEKHLIETGLVKFQPDLVIVYSGGNDANGRYGIDYTIPGADTNNSEDPIKKIIKEVDYRTPYVLLKNINEFKNYFQVENNSKNQVQELWTTRMNEICKTNNAAGIKSIVLVQPMLGSGMKQLSIDEEKLLENYGIYMVDTLDILDKMAISLAELENTCDKTYDLRMIFDDVKEPLFFDHIHVTDLGNEIIAEEIYKILINDL